MSVVYSSYATEERKKIIDYYMYNQVSYVETNNEWDILAFRNRTEEKVYIRFFCGEKVHVVYHIRDIKFDEMISDVIRDLDINYIVNNEVDESSYVVMKKEFYKQQDIADSVIKERLSKLYCRFIHNETGTVVGEAMAYDKKGKFIITLYNTGAPPISLIVDFEYGDDDKYESCLTITDTYEYATEMLMGENTAKSYFDHWKSGNSTRDKDVIVLWEFN